MTDSTIEFRILGPLTVVRNGQTVPLAGPKVRLLLAMLLLNAGRVVSVDKLVDALWGDESNDRAASTLQVHVSNLRKILGDTPPTIQRQAPGYIIRDASHLDATRFDQLVLAAREQAAGGKREAAERLLAEAHELWCGPALADLDGTEMVRTARTWLEERRLAAAEDRAGLLLQLGRHREVVTLVEPLVDAQPLRETLWELLVLALYRSGRQADALGAYARARQVLDDELGLEPGPRLRALELAVLQQDESLSAPEAVPAAHTPAAIELETTTKAPGQGVGRLTLEDGSVVPVEQRVSIGRHPDCDVTLIDSAVSRQHAEIRPALGRFLLIDQGSSNGTRVGGELMMQQLLVDGDVIEIGAHTLVFNCP